MNPRGKLLVFIIIGFLLFTFSGCNKKTQTNEEARQSEDNKKTKKEARQSEGNRNRCGTLVPETGK
jgi:hypothetical protein